MANIFIYGSCVTRDTYEHLDKIGNPLIDYVARPSLISAFSEPFAITADGSLLSSTFQIRNLQGDLDSNLPTRICIESPNYDLLLWDLADERLGVIDCGQGRYITRSVELVRSGLLDQIPKSKWIKFGSPEHLSLWKEAIDKFINLLNSQNLLHRVVLLDIPWSMYNELGEKTKSASSLSSDKANNTYAEYIKVILDTASISTVRLTWSQSISDSNHKWTESPYHYYSPVYKAIVKEIDGFSPENLSPKPEGPPVNTDAETNATPSPPISDTGALDWVECSDDPLNRIFEKPVHEFCVEFEAHSDAKSGFNMVLSLEFRAPLDFNPREYGFALSNNPDIGYFRYISLSYGQRRYFEHISLPESAQCVSVGIRKWNTEGNLKLRMLSVFEPVVLEPL